MNKQQSNIARFIMVCILTIAIAVMWVNNKNSSEEDGINVQKLK